MMLDRDDDDDIEEFSSPEKLLNFKELMFKLQNRQSPELSEIKLKKVISLVAVQGSHFVLVVLGFLLTSLLLSLGAWKNESGWMMFQVLILVLCQGSTYWNQILTMTTHPNATEIRSEQHKLIIHPQRERNLDLCHVAATDSDSEDDCPFTKRDLSRVQPSVASKPKKKEPRDLWKFFSPAAVSKIQTPALDDVCQDYFSSIKQSTSRQLRNKAVLWQVVAIWKDASRVMLLRSSAFIHASQLLESQGGQIGLSVDCEWAEANSEKMEDKVAADYPASMRQKLGDNLPTFTPEEKEFMLQNSWDFLGLNHYTSRLIAHVSNKEAESDFYQAQELEGGCIFC
ncbi:hypothetical protein Bca52824_018326 [Brassica carinata]|uniref:thioglucosidase n=1 Tax=Brassica carinata TaxID=52824 RepID=A0A8X8AWB0_BRACI|nr:hypothetical protein Bca52824_018326 [Brassica carinata]